MARKYFSKVPLAQVDLNSHLPIMPNSFSAVLCALVGEHLTQLQITFVELFQTLRTGGRLVYSVFHPEMAASGIEANFIQKDVEYRLGAEQYTISDYLTKIEEAGFRKLSFREYSIDQSLAESIPDASKYIDRPLLLIIEAYRLR
jgi:SAM-dependent methyltransferase